MKTVFHCITEISSNHFAKLEWILCDGKEIVQEGEVKIDSPSYYFDFIQFLLAVGQSTHVVAHDITAKLKMVGAAMKRNCLVLSLERKEKVTHVDLKVLYPDAPKPKNINEVFDLSINFI